MPCVLNERIKKGQNVSLFGIHGNQSSNIQSKLFITSLVITEYSISDIKLLGTDLFLLKFPLYNRIFT